MRMLTLTQPWASAILLGYKTFETRSWNTRYRGRIGIHAAKAMPTFAKQFAAEELMLGRLHDAPWPLPRGAVIGTCDLVGVERSDDIASSRMLGELERRYGDYAPGRFVWILCNVQPLPEPVPATGALGLWNWNPALRAI